MIGGAVLGPALGYIAGGAFTTLYVDFTQIIPR